MNIWMIYINGLSYADGCVLFSDCFELFLKNLSNFFVEMCGFRQCGFVPMNESHLFTVNLSDSRCFVSTAIRPGLEVDPCLMSLSETRARCHTKWIWKMVDVQRVDLRFKAKFISDNARQLTDEIGTAVGNRLRQRLKYSVPAILGTWLVAVVGIVEMLQNCLTIICVRFAIIWGNCLCSLLAWWWALSWVWWGHFISMGRTSAKYINKNWMDEWINE